MRLKTHAQHTGKKQGGFSAGQPAEKQNQQAATVHFTDNRPEATSQLKLQQAANESPQVKQLKTVQAMANEHHVGYVGTGAGKTGLPAQLKQGIEQLSGYAMNDVTVHYNSSQPAQFNAHAYAKGTDIHMAPGQEKHLPHEAWHVVQQKQGRVKPTRQLKATVSVNDDKDLEHEADVMGVKALGAGSSVEQSYDETSLQKKSIQLQGSSADLPVQRTLSIGQSPAVSVEDAYEQIITKKPKLEDYRWPILYGILPTYNSNNGVYVSVDTLIAQIEQILVTYSTLYHVDGHKSFSDYLHNQKLAQTKVKANPERFKSMVTTAGFEHEFADMKNSPIAGVSHMELARSAEAMPFTGLPFLVETDAANALELVSPPFLFPTVKGSTVPIAATVAAADKLMKSTLYDLLTKPPKWGPDTYWTRSYIDQTLAQLMVALSAATGFTFNLLNNIQIKPGYLSHKANLNTLAQHVTPSPDDGNALTLNADSLSNINLSKSEKGADESYSISSQVNFATDMATAGKLQKKQGVQNNETGIFRILDRELRRYIQPPEGGSPKLADFYGILIGKLAGLFSVYSQQHVRNTQTQLHADLVAKATPQAQDRNQGLPNPAAKKEFSLHAGLLSFVKDVTPAWVKDHALSIAKGMLVADDYPLLLASLKAANLGGFNLPQNIDAYLQEEGHTATAAHWQHFIAEVKSAISYLKIDIEVLIIPSGSSTAMDKKANVELYGHNSQYVGARQDTYRDPEKIQMPGIHDARLHVVEIRRGNPADQLESLGNDL